MVLESLEWSASFGIRKEIYHGTFRTSKHFDSREYQRHGRSRGRSGKNDQAGDPRHGESVSPGQDAGGGFHRRPAHAGEEVARERGLRQRLDAQGRNRRGQEPG